MKGSRTQPNEKRMVVESRRQTIFMEDILDQLRPETLDFSYDKSLNDNSFVEGGGHHY